MLQGWVKQDHFCLWTCNLFKGQPFLSLDSFDWTRMLGSELHLAGMKDCCNLAHENYAPIVHSVALRESVGVKLARYLRLVAFEAPSGVSALMLRKPHNHTISVQSS